MEYDEGYSHQRVKLSTCAVSGICEASTRFAFLPHPVGGELGLGDSEVRMDRIYDDSSAAAPCSSIRFT